MIQGIDNVGVAVTQLERSIEFYGRLGFEKGDDFPGMKGCTVSAGSAVLFLFQTEQTDPPVKRDDSLVGNPPGLDHLSFAVDDVDATYRELSARGVAFLGEPADQDWGARLVGLKDPDGNVLYFLKYL